MRKGEPLRGQNHQGDENRTTEETRKEREGQNKKFVFAERSYKGAGVCNMVHEEKGREGDGAKV